MEEKQKTLRPEIQLLNNLMAATTVPERERVSLQCPSTLTDCALNPCLCATSLYRPCRFSIASLCTLLCTLASHNGAIINSLSAGSGRRGSQESAGHEQRLFLWLAGQDDIRLVRSNLGSWQIDTHLPSTPLADVCPLLHSLASVAGCVLPAARSLHSDAG